ncbi:Kinesin-like protein kif20a [Puccinia graminis f. sp. tritici]|uniref:Kinesin-like protein kif20a n=1 Tax=Puccinia graminis f. sp. tritici TaxID=56615 RepID=A0A5B0PM88_PUCGR|nr:Kinesin-like protein kif20a [Puccinia graminis f. sp. tritici]
MKYWACVNKDVTDLIPGSVFIGDRIENGPDTGYRYWIAPPNPIPMYWKTGIGWSDPIPIPGIGSIFDPIPDKYRSGDRIAYTRSIWVPDRDCNAIPIPIQYHFDTIPWDRITLSDPIPYFSIPGIEKSIRSDKSADTVSDRICFTFGLH